MTTAAAREQMERFEADRRSGAALARVLASSDGAPSVDRLSDLAVGFTVWSKTNMDTDDLSKMRMGFDGGSVGGLVVDVIDKPGVDDETGEVRGRRAFRCFNFYGRPANPACWHTLTEAQVLIEACEPPQPARIAGVCRRFWSDLWPRKGQMSGFEIDLAIYAARLASLLGQRRPS